MAHETIRSYLQETLVDRCRKNPSYSLRAFARQLKVEPSALSKILRGQRSVSQKMFDHLCAGLELSPTKVSELRRGQRFPVKNTLDRYNHLSSQQFEMISQWYHFAILELIQTKNFQADAQWIAKSLKISLHEANAAIDRLMELGFITVNQDGSWNLAKPNNSTLSNKFTTTAFRLQQKEVLQLAIDAIDNIEYEKRSHTNVTVACDVSLVPEIKLRIQQFHRDIIHFIEQAPKPKDVFQLSVAFFPATQIKEDV